MSIQKGYIAPMTKVVSLHGTALMQETEYDGSTEQTNNSFDNGTTLVSSSGVTVTGGWSEEKSETGSQMGKDGDNAFYDENPWLLEW